MQRYKKLINNTLIFSIGNFGSKFISFFLTPFLTLYLTPDQLGEADFYVTMVNLLLPIVTFNLFEAVLRFIVDDKSQSTEFLTVAIKLYSLVLLLTLVGSYLGAYYFENRYILLIWLMIAVQGYYQIILQYIRGIGKIKLFAFTGLFFSVLLFGTTYLFLACFKLTIVGYLYAQICTYVSLLIFLLIKERIILLAWQTKASKEIARTMLVYSLPLIPNSLLWWVISVSDRYLIIYYLGFSAAGIYVVANKIPIVMSMFYQVFNQAWQLSIMEEAKSQDRDRYFNHLFLIIFCLMLCLFSFCLLVLEPLVSALIDASYLESLIYIPWLMLGVIFSSLSTFVGAKYLVSKQTRYLFGTSLVGAIVNLIVNFFLIQKWGMLGTSFATCFSFLLVLFLRLKPQKTINDVIQLKFKRRKLVLPIALAAGQTLTYRSFESQWLQLFFIGAMFLTCWRLYQKNGKNT